MVYNRKLIILYICSQSPQSVNCQHLTDQVTTQSSEGMITRSGRAIKLVLTENVPYKIIKCKLDTSGKFGAVLHADVVAYMCKFTPSGKFVPVDGKVFSTYFSPLYTKKFIKKAKLQGFNLETSPELLIDLKFIYRGEVESGEGNTYSKLEFCGEGGGGGLGGVA